MNKNEAKEYKRTAAGIIGEISMMFCEFLCEHGRPPNTLRIRGYDLDILQRHSAAQAFNSKPDVTNEVKYEWYMGMRIIAEHWTFKVEWTQESETLEAQ